MILTDENVYHYLIERDLVQNETVVGGDFMAQHFPTTRNNIIKVFLKTGTSFFIKQCTTDGVFKDILKRESNVYKLLHSNDLFSNFSNRLPSMLDYDDERNVLITELKQDTISLHDYYLKARTFPVALGIEQAQSLSGFHVLLSAETDVKSFPHTPPWILQLNDFNAYHYFPTNTENGKFIQLIQQNELLKNELDKLKKGWTKTHFIHGDIKWINFLIDHKNESQTLFVIDWELADVGDPCWDVAGLLQSYISAWVFGFDNQVPSATKLHDNLSAFELEHMLPSIEIFLDTYLSLQGIGQTGRLTWLVKTMQYTAARILQTAIEGVVFDPNIYANNMRCMQLAFNIFKDPQAALTGLLGIKL